MYVSSLMVFLQTVLQTLKSFHLCVSGIMKRIFKRFPGFNNIINTHFALTQQRQEAEQLKMEQYSEELKVVRDKRMKKEAKHLRKLDTMRRQQLDEEIRQKDEEDRKKKEQEELRNK